VERSLGLAVPEQAKQLCRLLGWVGDYFAADEAVDRESEEADRAEALETIRQTILALKGAGYLPLATLEPDVPDDGRWALLSDLSAATERAGGHWAAHGATYQPVRMRRMYDGDVYPPAPYVRIDVDARLSLRTLVAVLRKAWPDLLRDGWARRTRPLGDRALALLRFVSLEAPKGSTWRERQAAWNEAVAGRGWEYEDVRDLERKFRRAELQLTGVRDGLHHLHDTSPPRLTAADVRRWANVETDIIVRQSGGERDLSLGSTNGPEAKPKDGGKR